MIGKCLWGVVCLIAAGALAQAQTRSQKGAPEFVLMTMMNVEECIAADDLLRKSCARVGGKLPDRSKTYCDLPAAPFEARTARSYATFKETFRTEVKEIEANFAAAMRRARASFERQFEQTRAGRISMMDLELLSDLLERRCRLVESRWLAPERWPR